MKRLGVTGLTLVGLAGLCAQLTSCARPEGDRSEAAPPDRPLSPAAPFVERALDSGLDFVHTNGMSGELYYNEMMGSGAALFDFDNDGDLDAYLVQGEPLGPSDARAGSDAPSDRLFRNDLVRDDPENRPAERHPARFTDVTTEAGIPPGGYGMGVAAADYDNDGWTDLYVTNFGANRLLRNTGEGRFEDVTAESGTDDSRWSIAAVWFDYDRDGWLDLWVGNYVDFSLAAHSPCALPSGVATYCGPGTYPPETDRLFRNLGDGTFEETSIPSQLGLVAATTLGAVAADFDGDGLADLYVANDLMSNNLWINRGDGRFEDRALLAGVAVNREGQPEASMGVDAADFDRDGDLDLFLTHLSQETNTLYVNLGQGLFEDLSVSSGLGPPSLAFTGFGTGWLDYDRDGWLDLLAVNGAVIGIEALVRAGDPYPLHQPNQLFHNNGGAFVETTRGAGAAFELSEVGRGAAFGDVDNDGDTDVLIQNNNGRARLLINQSEGGGAWLGVRATTGGRDALGAEVTLEAAPDQTLLRRIHTDGSYASANDPRVSFPLDDRISGGLRLSVRWPDGRSEIFIVAERDRYVELAQGDGEPAD